MGFGRYWEVKEVDIVAQITSLPGEWQAGIEICL